MPVNLINGSAMIAGYGLGMKAAVGHRFVLCATGFTHHKNIHRGLVPVVRQGPDNGKTRSAIGAVDKRWKTAHIDDWRNIITIRPSSANINNEMYIGGPSNQIIPLTLNTDFLISPDSGITNIEQLRFENSTITNLNITTPITLSSVGTGYFKFSGTNGLVIPSGDISERPLSPEIGDTRWNTELGYLECFDGNVYITSIGPGDPLLPEDMEELSNLYSIILG